MINSHGSYIYDVPTALWMENLSIEDANQRFEEEGFDITNPDGMGYVLINKCFVILRAKAEVHKGYNTVFLIYNQDGQHSIVEVQAAELLKSNKLDERGRHLLRQRKCPAIKEWDSAIEKEDRARFNISEAFRGPNFQNNGARNYTYGGEDITIGPNGRCVETYECYNDVDGHHYKTRERK